jgi:hypothetical protein
MHRRGFALPTTTQPNTEATMQYVMNEGTVDFGVWPDDRSVNVLMLPNPEPGDPLTLVITRDAMEPGEDLDGCVKRQLALIARQLRGFKELRRDGAVIGKAQTPSVIVEGQHVTPGTTVHQLMAVVPFRKTRILVFCLSCAKPLGEAQRKVWHELLASFAEAEV